MSRHNILPERIVLSSSRAVYGDGKWLLDTGGEAYVSPRTNIDLQNGFWNPRSASGQPVASLSHNAASTEPRPTNVYAATKLAQEHLIRAWCAAFGVRSGILRLQNVYGPGQAVQNSYTGVLTFFAKTALAGRSINLFEDGNILRDFVFVDDVVRALICMLSQESQDLVLDIGSGRPVTLHEAALVLSSLAGSPEPHVSGEFRHGDVRAASASIEQTVRVLEWNPVTSFEVGAKLLLSSVAASPTNT
jgi:dTDP-L-rhamnose 4-epimerase